MSRELSWTSLVTRHRPWVAAAFAVCALYGVGIALVSTDFLHRDWGFMAATGYGAGAIAVLAWRSRGADLALVLSLLGAVLVPLAWMATVGQGQPEVYVIMKSALSLVHEGTPYVPISVLRHSTNPDVYNPYLPSMTIFALLWTAAPNVPLTDPRIWFGIVFLVVFAFSLRVAGARDYVRWALLVTASPVIAFELCVGGDDGPMVAFLCLGFALLWRTARSQAARSNAVAAGLALGVASSMKATAWPAVVVAFALLYVRDGKREAWRFIAVAVAVVVVVVGPFTVLNPGSLFKNTVLFPLGLAGVQSAAASPLLGHLLAQTGRLGHTIVVILLVAAVLAIGVSLVIRPPRDVPAATWRLVIGLSVLFVLAPSTRFGYFIYPAALVAWLLIAQAGRASRNVSSWPDSS